MENNLLNPYLYGFIADLHGGFVLKQLNYPISMLAIVFRSVDHIVNDHLIINFILLFYSFILSGVVLVFTIQQIVGKKTVIYKTMN